MLRNHNGSLTTSSTKPIAKKDTWAKQVAHDINSLGFKVEKNPSAADITITVDEAAKKIILTFTNGKRYEHDFSCNGYYAEMFRVIRELLGIDSRVKWFNEIKDEFFGSICFKGPSKWSDNF